MEQPCLFCRIAAGELPVTTVAEGERWLAFRDIDPKAPVHVLIIPRVHVASLSELDEGDRELTAELVFAAVEVARLEGIADDGYRVVTNTGERAGQSVFHLHLHVLGGRKMTWPPG